MASLLVLLSASAAVAQDVDRGRLLAQRWCAACHVVDRAAARGAADGLPTFPTIAENPSTTDGRLRGFMTAAHGRMPDFSLGAAEQNDLIAYILSLRSR